MLHANIFNFCIKLNDQERDERMARLRRERGSASSGGAMTTPEIIRQIVSLFFFFNFNRNI